MPVIIADLDAIAGASDGEQLFFLIRGRFEWNQFKRYVLARGGTCRSRSCAVPTSKSGFWANLVLVQPGVAGLAISANSAAADTLRREVPQTGAPPPSNPIWVSVSKTLLTKPERREVEVPVRYVGFEIPNRFVIGYGLDFGERYRNLPYVGVLDPSLVP